MTNWMVFFDSYSRHVEIYRNDGGRKDLVKVADSNLEACDYLDAKVQPQDVLTFRKANRRSRQDSRITGTMFRATYADRRNQQWWTLVN